MINAEPNKRKRDTTWNFDCLRPIIKKQHKAADNVFVWLRTLKVNGSRFWYAINVAMFCILYKAAGTPAMANHVDTFHPAITDAQVPLKDRIENEIMNFATSFSSCLA